MLNWVLTVHHCVLLSVAEWHTQPPACYPDSGASKLRCPSSIASTGVLVILMLPAVIQHGWQSSKNFELTPRLVSAFLLPGRTPKSFWQGYRAGMGMTFSLFVGALFMSAALAAGSYAMMCSAPL